MGFYIARRALSASSSEYKKGLHRGHPSGLVGVDADLVADNIKWNTTLFGILGSLVIWRWTFAEFLAAPSIPAISKIVVENHSGGSFPESFSLAVPTIPSIAKSLALTYEVIDDCEVAWDEYVGTGVTVSVDNVDFKVGSGCNKWDMAAGASVGRLATNNFGPIDARAYTNIKFWIKSSITINTNELSLLLDDTAQCVSPIKDLNIGALTANTWTEKIFALGDTSGLGAICSVGIDQDVDKGAFTLRIDQVRLTKGG
jgi:hypothetical protein